jgi:hypothetical protein
MPEIFSSAALFLAGRSIPYKQLERGDCRCACPKCGAVTFLVHRDGAWSFCMNGFECYAQSDTAKELEKLFVKK